MAESIEEQIEYGNRCEPHGNPVGTPGGADIMCHECEMGYNTWVDDPLWRLQVGPKGGPAYFHTFSFREGEYRNPSIQTKRKMVSMKHFLEMFGTEDAALTEFYYEMHSIAAGYWTE